MNRLEVAIHFDNLETNLPDANVHIYIEDISEAGAPSKTLSENHLYHVSVESDPAIFHASVDFPPSAPDADLSLRVHVDVNGDGDLTPGDYLTTSIHSLKRLAAKPAQQDVLVSRI